MEQPAEGGLDDGGGGGGSDDGGGGGGAVRPEAPLDTIVVFLGGGGEVRFPNADGHYDVAFEKLVVTGDRLTAADAESFTVAVGTETAGEFTCDTTHVIAYNARNERGEPVFWSTRFEGGRCALTLDEVGEVDGRIVGSFDGVVMTEDGQQADLRGAFNVLRLPDE